MNNSPDTFRIVIAFDADIETESFVFEAYVTNGVTDGAVKVDAEFWKKI